MEKLNIFVDKDDILASTFRQENNRCYIELECLKAYGLNYNPLTINKGIPKKYTINTESTTLIWEDDTKTIVKRVKEDKYDKRLGFLIAYFQKHSGLSKKKANAYLNSLIDDTRVSIEDYAKVEDKDVSRLIDDILKESSACFKYKSMKPAEIKINSTLNYSINKRKRITALLKALIRKRYGLTPIITFESVKNGLKYHIIYIHKNWSPNPFYSGRTANNIIFDEFRDVRREEVYK